MVNFQGNEIRLNTNLDERFFAKVRYDSGLQEDGLLVTCSTLKNNSYTFDFSPWHFKEIKSFDVEGKDYPQVFYCGECKELSPETKTLLQIMQEASSEDATKEQKTKLQQVLYILCNLLTHVATQGLSQNFPQNGAGSILVDLKNEDTKFLFLPGNLFKYSTNSLSKEESFYEYNALVNPTLDGLPAICFERAVIAYKLLTSRFPFENFDPVERNSDILDKNFLPVELCIESVNSTLAYEINRALKLNSDYVNRPEHMKRGKTSEELRPAQDFPLPLLFEEINKIPETQISSQEFAKKVQAHIKSQQHVINAKRRIRKNTTVITIAVAVIAFVTVFTFSTIKTIRQSATSMGLTSTQTIEAFYQGLNNKDTTQMENMCINNAAKSIIKTVSQIWVMSSQRQYYEHGNGYASPQNWLFYVNDKESDSKSGIYGVTNVTIDNVNSDLTLFVPLKNEKHAPITEEKGISLKNGSISVHKVDYYYLYSEGEDFAFEVNKVSEIITLTYSNNRWCISQIQSEATSYEFNCTKFKEDYFTLLKNNNNNVIDACASLRSKYPFLPSQDVLDYEELRLKYIAEDVWGRDATNRTGL